MTGRLLGIDHGLKRIGLAISDESGLVARELTIIQRESNAQDFARIHAIVKENLISGIVVGLPLNPEADDDAQPQRVTVVHWIERLRHAIPLPITTWDEQLTSMDAREISIRKGRRSRDAIDDLAARVMLQSYLDARRDGLVRPHQVG